MDIVRDHVEATNERADSEFFADILESVSRRGRSPRPWWRELRTWRWWCSARHTPPGTDCGSTRSACARSTLAVDREIAAIAEAMGRTRASWWWPPTGSTARTGDALMADFCRRLGYSPAPAGLRRPADVLARRAPRPLRALAAAPSPARA